MEANLRSTPNYALNAVAGLWVIWLARNEMVWNGNAWPLSKLLKDINELVKLWTDTYVNSDSHRSPRPSCSTHILHRQPRSILRCNVDAALKGEDVGYGAVICAHTGQFVAARSGKLSCAPIPYLAETMAVKEALSWLKSRSIREVIIETDCQAFCISYNSGLLDLSYVGLVVKQCQSIARDVGNVQVRHVRKSGNHVAHALARATVSLSVLGVWDDHPPSCIAHLI
ncbi:PREDICTED: uncharacterized protein LOC109172171 [Ipomoea nil]|nr:PREDICTED: uncharacterized protein LOC109172171 [Ipomoea nil]